MDKILIAIVTGLFTLIVAIIALITSIINSRNANKMANKLEEIKQSYALSYKTLEITDTHLLESLSSLKESINAIQALKDEILIVISSIETSLFAEEAIRRIKAARENIFKVFQEHNANLDKMEHKAFHLAKGIALNIDKIISKELKDKHYASQMSPIVMESISDIRLKLTECQNILRDSRMDRFINRTLKA